MKLRLTLFNILSGAIVFLAASIYLNLFRNTFYDGVSVSNLLLIALLLFITDILFRVFVKELKRIWIVETCFIIFVLAIIGLIK